jgi:hypothetical protein
MFDDDVAVPTLDELLNWLAQPVPAPLTFEEAHDHFLLMHPRIVYLKTLPLNSVVFDIGAGEGTLRHFRSWLGFMRPDLQFVGASLQHAGATRDYEEFFVGNIEIEKPSFKLVPRHAIAAQFLEHISDPGSLIKWLASVIPVGGSVHIDWPARHTRHLPSRQEFLNRGFDMSVLKFEDDGTHKFAFGASELSSILTANGFRIRSGGLHDLPYLADCLKHHGLERKDAYLLTMALWLKTRFVAYLVAERV